MNPFLKLFAFLYTKHVEKLEHKIGYQVLFPAIPDTWINGYMKLDMKKAWTRYHNNAIGVDYWTVGALKNNVSSRYIRTEKQYQSWLGAYLVKFESHKDFTLQDHFDLAVSDQMDWLEDFGDPQPFIKMPENQAGKPEQMTISGFQAKLYEFSGGPSHSDVGSQVNNWKNKILMAFASAMFNKTNKKFLLRGSSLIPKEIFSEYETVILKGYVAIVELKKDIKVVLYGNGTALLDENGKEIKDYTPFLKDDILKAFKAVEIKKV